MNRQNIARAAPADMGPVPASGKTTAGQSSGLSADQNPVYGIKSAVPVMGDVRVLERQNGSRKQKIRRTGLVMQGILSCGKMRDGAKSVTGIPAKSLAGEQLNKGFTPQSPIDIIKVPSKRHL